MRFGEKSLESGLIGLFPPAGGKTGPQLSQYDQRDPDFGRRFNSPNDRVVASVEVRNTDWRRWPSGAPKSLSNLGVDTPLLFQRGQSLVVHQALAGNVGEIAIFHWPAVDA